MNAVYKFTYSIVLVMSVLFVMAASSPAPSAEMVVVDKEAIFIDGDILKGDGDAFIKLLDENPEVKYVSINSYGGLVDEGMIIAFVVNERKLVTFVSRDGICYSMCSVIFMSGYDRVLAVGQSIGFHPAYIEWEDGKTEVDPQASAYISWWLGKLGVPAKVIWDMMATSPSEVVLFTGIELNNMGMDLFLLE